MKQIGLIGEDPNDTRALQSLLTQQFRDRVQFKPILRNKRGHHLDNVSLQNALKIELANNDYDIIIFIRDLDGLETEKDKVKKKLEWFNKLNTLCSNKGLFLLNIYELEALILADIEIFNKEYKSKLSNMGNVMFIDKPKEFLIQKTSRLKKIYNESHCPALFKKLRYKTVQANCKYFREFTNNLENQLKTKLQRSNRSRLR